jgi:hypothetical protein
MATATWWGTASVIFMIVSSLTTTGRSTLSVWNKSKSSNHLKHSHLCFRVCCLCCLLYVNSESIERYFCSTWSTRKLLFCSFLSSHFRTDWVLLPNETRNWTRAITLCTLGRPNFVYKRSIVHKIPIWDTRWDEVLNLLDYRQQRRTRCPAENPLRCFHENNGNGFAGRCFVV